MIRVYGCNVADQHARGLIASLLRSDTDDAFAAAEKISVALARRGSAGQLTPGMRDAVLQALERPLYSGLHDLHEALARDQRARH